MNCPRCNAGCALIESVLNADADRADRYSFFCGTVWDEDGYWWFSCYRHS